MREPIGSMIRKTKRQGYIIRESDMGRRLDYHFGGHVIKIDIGKKCYVSSDGLFGIENDDQRNEREHAMPANIIKNSIALLPDVHVEIRTVTSQEIVYRLQFDDDVTDDTADEVYAMVERVYQPATMKFIAVRPAYNRLTGESFDPETKTGYLRVELKTD